ncbi:hypothetical protein [Saccharicrinis sp. FJH54]|uniref:hypothetical protein n=1 Tax=Saccharicrinis sp. FJH54 TaxID=3344665 RepID=UPI0035D4A723
MKFWIPVVAMLMFLYSANGQSAFKTGYYINSHGTRINCLIDNRNLDKAIPEKLKYKMNDLSKVQKIRTDSIKEFFVSGYYFKKLPDAGYRTDPNKPNASEYFRILSRSDYSLLMSYHGGHKIFLVELPDKDRIVLNPEQKNPGSAFSDSDNNNEERLREILACDEMDSSRFSQIRYNEKSLIKLMTEVYGCRKDRYQIYNAETKDVFKPVKYNLRLGTGFALYEESKYSNKADNVIQLGFETEYMLGRKSNPFVISAELFTGYFYGTTYSNYIHRFIDLKYFSVYLVPALKQYIKIKDNTLISLNLGIGMGIENIIPSDNFTFFSNTGTGRMFSNYQYIGTSVKIKDKYNVECRFFNHDFDFAKYKGIPFRASSIALILGYTL